MITTTTSDAQRAAAGTAGTTDEALGNGTGVSAAWLIPTLLDPDAVDEAFRQLVIETIDRLKSLDSVAFIEGARQPEDGE